VFNCFGEDGKVFIVMEFFAGGSIYDLLQLVVQNQVEMELICVILK
jgi:serine/threonine protein kinase